MVDFFNIGIYNITVIASDGFSNVSDYFLLKVDNKPPIPVSLANQSYVLGQKINFFLPSDSFQDPEQYQLGYQAFLVNDDSLDSLPAWLNFDSGRLFLNDIFFKLLKADTIKNLKSK